MQIASTSGVRDTLGTTHWPRVLALSCAAVIAMLALWGWEDVLPLLVVPLLVGVALGCSCETRAETLTAGVLSGAVGTAAAAWIYEPARLSAAVASLPQWMREDVPAETYSNGAAGLWRNSAPVSAYVTHHSHLPMLVAGTLLVPMFALAALELRSYQRTQRVALWMPWVASILMAICLVVGVAGSEADWFAHLSTPISPGAYATDMFSNVATVEIMKSENEGFYAADTEAVLQDRRTSQSVADSGKLPYLSGGQIREPTMFYLWRLLTLDAPSSAIAWFSLVCAACMLPLLFWGLRPAVGDRSLFVTFALFPGLALWSSTAGSLLPEWWALLCLLVAFAALVRGKLVLALSFGLAAVLFRETTGLWLLCAAAVTGLLGLGDRRWWRLAAASAGLLACAIVAFLLHVRAGSPYIAHEVGGLASYMAERHTRSFALRALAPLSYLMLPYGLDAFAPAYLLPIGIVGLWVGLARAPLARLVTTSYTAAMALFFLAVGATSTYWGQILNPFTVIGVMLLVVSLDRLGSARVWRFERPDAPAPDWPRRPKTARVARPDEVSS